MSSLMTAAQVAERLGLRPGRIYELARIGKLPCVRMVRQVRFDHEQIERFIASGGNFPEPPDNAPEPPLTPFRR